MGVEFTGWRRFRERDQPWAERIGFLSDKSMILPGKKIDVVQIWTADDGYEVTYKGRRPCPKDIVADYQRRQEALDRDGDATMDQGPGRDDSGGGDDDGGAPHGR